MLQKGVLSFRKRIDNKEDYIIFAEIVHLFLRDILYISPLRSRANPYTTNIQTYTTRTTIQYLLS